jgi:hypothetical protein
MVEADTHQVERAVMELYATGWCSGNTPRYSVGLECVWGASDLRDKRFNDGPGPRR